MNWNDKVETTLTQMSLFFSAQTCVHKFTILAEVGEGNRPLPPLAKPLLCNDSNMGGTKNLMLEDRARARGSVSFFVCGTIADLYLVVVCIKKTSSGRVPGRGNQGAKSPFDAETLSASEGWTETACFLIFSKRKITEIFVVLQKWGLMSHTLDYVMVTGLECTLSPSKFLLGHWGGKGKGIGGSCPPFRTASSSSVAHGLK